MAPKRATTAKAPHAKKAKTATPEAPILHFIGKCDNLPEPCREMLQVAVPICLEVVESDRHKFQTEILGRVAALLAGVEHTKRGALSESEAALAAINADKETTAADGSVKKATSEAKKAECDAKGEVVAEADKVLKAAQKVLKDAQKEQADFNKKKSDLISEQESFGKLMTETFEPLKGGTVQGNWRNKAKHITELQKKLSDLGAQESLSDALATTLKMTPEKREGTFAKATMQFAQDYFNKHTAKVAQDIASLDAEEATHTTAIAGAEATVAEKNAAHAQQAKEYDEMQDVWIELDKTSAEAAKKERQLDGSVPKAQKTIDRANADLAKFLEIPALFAQLKEHSTAVAEEPEEEAAEEEHAAEGEKPDEAM